MLTNNVLRVSEQLIRNARCQVCQGTMRLRIRPDAAGVMIIGFLCHGSYQFFTLDDTCMSEREVVEAVLGFAEKAFAEEARSPDLRELIAYNRGAVPC